MNRRDFLKQSGMVIGAAAAGGAFSCADQAGPSAQSKDAREVVIVHDPADPVAADRAAQWAMEHLKSALSARGIPARIGRGLGDVPEGATRIVAAGAKSSMARDALKQRQLSVPDAPESLVLSSATLGNRPALLACGSDARGLVYALTEIADAVTYAAEPAAALQDSSPMVEKPANQIRSNMRLFSSDVEDKSWFNDRGFWDRYLTMLVSQRFNRFNLALGLGYDFPSGIRDAYFYFEYPFLLSVPGYNVRVPQLPDAERDKNLEMLRFISDQCAARGLLFQLGLWTHAYQWTNSPNANYTVEGLNADNHAPYCRDAVRTLLRECPNISAVTFRIHGESGVPEGSYDFWKTVFDGVKTCGRSVVLDMHAKGMDQPMIDIALATGLPITISPKYWAEHMGLPYHQAWIRPTEMPRENRANDGFFSRSSGSRSFLRYGYGDLMRKDRKYGIVYRMWPGTQRVLIWGDPQMAAAYGRASSFCGGLGIDLFEPLSFKGRKGSGFAGGRDAYADASMNRADDWEKFSYGYRLWGRMTYNPDAAPQTYRRELQKTFGGAAPQMETALASAGRILPLITTAHLPSAANNSYWPEIYTNMPIVNASRRHPYGDTPSPKRFGTVSPLDPQLFSRIDDFAKELHNDEMSGKYSPPEVAHWLVNFADSVPDGLAKNPVTDDVEIQCSIGRFFAWKLRAGVLYALFERTSDPATIKAAVQAYQSARAYFNAIVMGPGKSYRSDITYGLERQLRGHWSDRLPAIDADIADMQKRADEAGSASSAPQATTDSIRKMIAAVLSPPPRPSLPIAHVAPVSFHRNQDLPIEFSCDTAGVEAKLFYRHVNQAEPWKSDAMKSDRPRHQATIAAAYANSEFPLQYYFELRQADKGPAWLYPGFNATLTNQPYFVIRQA